MDVDDIQHDDSMPLNERIGAAEERLMLDRASAAVHAQEFKRRTKWRATTPTAILFATSMGFVTGEVLRSRSRAMAGRRGGKGAKKGPLGAILSPVASVLKKGMIFI